MSLVNELKAEITRLARKEIKKELGPVKKVNANQRGYIADLRKEIADLQKEVARLKREGARTVPAVEKAPSRKFWITGKGVKSLREKLQLTQGALAELAGVSVQSVVNWESRTGKIAFRKPETAARMQEIRGMTKREAWEALG